jgi:hypothetical protein
MLDLAISIDSNDRDTTIIETNRGFQLRAPRWPHDCEFQLVAFSPFGRTCEVISTEHITEDIASALEALEVARVLKGKKPDWHRRLFRYAKGAHTHEVNASPRRQEGRKAE